ncbi:hypothetical protein CRG98_001877 [Punica granatum]|uniref:Uncharacterized protein n=1 Tax=Punica granatum TaxID=22663 RepID=A0A2I0LAN4_PUNGR|nr:hypothetical protein CRG98_001877 [Punica granatum]
MARASGSHSLVGGIIMQSIGKRNGLVGVVQIRRGTCIGWRRVHVHKRGGDVLARRRMMRSVELVDVRAQSRGDMLGCSEGWVAGMNGLWSRHISPWRGEDCRWSTRKGGHNSPVVRKC